MTNKHTDKRNKNEKAKTQAYEIISGSFSTFDDNGERVKLRAGEIIHLTPEKAKKLVNIVRPVNVVAEKVAEAPAGKAADVSLRPLNEVGAGLPQDANKPAEIEDAKVPAALDAAAKTAEGAKSEGNAAGTTQVEPAKDAGKGNK